MHDTTSAPIKPVLFVLTSHGTKGDTGQPTGYYLGEVTHPLAQLDDAGIPVEFASIRGGEPPVDGLDLDDPVNARYWNDPRFRAAVGRTSGCAERRTYFFFRSAPPSSFCVSKRFLVAS